MLAKLVMLKPFLLKPKAHLRSKNETSTLTMCEKAWLRKKTQLYIG